MNVVGYVRLSRDENRENYSSIESQKDIILDYADRKKWKVQKMYIDDNESGYKVLEDDDTIFDRPAFREMMEDIKKGNIDVVLTKDLSRFGRKNGLVQFLIDRFKRYNIRLIFIKEGDGGFDILEDNDDILGIKTWYNEMYVKDISRKIRANMNAKQRKGELIMGNFYGYEKIKGNDKFKLVVDESIRPIIQLIFQLYLEGLGYKKICDILNEKGYITPSEYIKERQERNGKVFKNSVTDRWQTHMIPRIISNDIYIGVLRTRKKEVKTIKGKAEKVNQDEQYVFENNHEPIISKDDFDNAQLMRNKRTRVNYQDMTRHNYIFSGFIVCGTCKSPAIGLNLKTKPKIEYGYNCIKYQKYGKKLCVTHAIKEKRVLFFLKEYLRDLKYKYEDYLKTNDFKTKTRNINNTMQRLQKEYDITNAEIKLLLNQKIKDLSKEQDFEYRKIIEDNYIELENDKKKRLIDIKKQMNELNLIDANNLKENIQTTIEKFDKIIESEVPSRKLLSSILDKIIVYHDRTLEFVLINSIDKILNDN